MVVVAARAARKMAENCILGKLLVEMKLCVKCLKCWRSLSALKAMKTIWWEMGSFLYVIYMNASPYLSQANIYRFLS
jgi:hypothetical protein